MSTKKRQYRSGSIRERKGRFYIRWYDADGQRQEEAAGTDERAANRLLRQRIGEVAAGGARRAKARADVTVGEVLDLYLAEQRRRERANYRICKYKVDSILRPAIGWMKAAGFAWKNAWAYVEERRAAGRADSTINRELSLIRAAFKLAASPVHGLVAIAPVIPGLEEPDNVRTGFLRPEQYERMRAALPEYLRPLFCVAYYTGLRRSTLLGLRLDQVDLAEGVIWISRKQVKNRKAQTVPILAGEMRGYCEMAVAAHQRYLFEHEGRQIRSFKAAWKAARVEAGLPDLLFHDLRRTAVRDWIAAGINEALALSISGHKTPSMLQRYNIIDAANSVRAGALREEFERQKAAAVGDKLGDKQGKEQNAKPS